MIFFRQLSGLTLILFSVVLLGITVYDSKSSHVYQLIFRKSISSPHFKILVSVAAHSSPGRPLSVEYLYRLLYEYEEKYTAGGYSVHVCIDTNSAELSDLLSSHKVVNSTREVRVWTLEELDGDPERLPHMHRRLWQERENEFDFFIFTEDDILYTLESFQVYVDRRLPLQEKGWNFGGVLVETWGRDNETLVAIGIIESRPIKTVFKTSNGHLWAEPWIPYTAHYVLDREELRTMIEDESGVWITGFPAIDTRANIATGYNYKFSGNPNSNPKGAQGWQSRSLVPITRDCKVESAGLVYHMPSKYAKNTQLVKNSDCIDGGPERNIWGKGSNLVCSLGIIPLTRVFLCLDLNPIPLPIWPEGARLI